MSLLFSFFQVEFNFKLSSARQKKAIRKEEEKDLQKREAENADGRAADNPRSVEDFERLLLTQGDTSIVWIRCLGSSSSSFGHDPKNFF